MSVPWGADDAFLMALTALPAGLAFGYCAQRGGFCLTRALSNLVLMGDGTLARAYLLAFLVATAGTQLLGLIGQVTPSFGLEVLPSRPFRWLANLTGGLLFGVGMVLAGGCAGSTWYRLGEGALGAGLVLLGFAMGATAAQVGVLAPLRRWLQRPELVLGEAPPTLPAVVGLGPGWVLLALGVLAAPWLLRGRGEPVHAKWRWPATGVAMGVVIALGWYLSSVPGPPVGITFAANTGEVLTYPLVGYPTRVRWGMLLLPGVVAGAWLAAWRHGEFAWKVPPGFTGVRLFGAGLLMGSGAVVADGCNITQGLTYGATLSLGSLLAFLAMLVGGTVTLRLLYLRP